MAEESLKRPAEEVAEEPPSKLPTITKDIDFFDPHFHIWDVSPTTTTGHDGNLFPAHGKDVYDTKAYEAEFDKLPKGLQHVGGVFLEAVSVCHLEKSGPEYSKHCIEELQYASDELKGSSKSYLLVPTCALEQEDAAEMLAGFAKNDKVRGIRQILNVQPNWPRNERLGNLLENPKWQQGFALLKDFNLSFDLHHNPRQFKQALSILEKHPETTVIIDHMGCPTMDDLTTNSDQYWSGMEGFAKLPNTFIKLSMFCYPDKDWDKNETVIETVHRIIGLFGTNRCMIASNYPVDEKDGWPADRLFSALLALTERYSVQQRQELFAGTAMRAYRL